MEKEKLETLLIDYIDGKLTEAECREVDEELKRNTEAFKTYEQLKEVIHAMKSSAKFEPSLKLKSGFDHLLQEEILQMKKLNNESFFLYEKMKSWQISVTRR